MGGGLEGGGGDTVTYFFLNIAQPSMSESQKCEMC